jgi:bisphosphoglycerate-independent phosphoglycerate mutase (AlkP superfamily)
MQSALPASAASRNLLSLGSRQDGVTDEFIKPAVISPAHTIQSGDMLLFYNCQADIAPTILDLLGVGKTY